MHDTEVIAAHVYQGSESYRQCSCGWEWPEKRTYVHATVLFRPTPTPGETP